MEPRSWPSFDLPIALSMIACEEERERPNAEEFCFPGELELTGAVRPVLGGATGGDFERAFGRHRCVE